jgi:hypothetical protein
MTKWIAVLAPIALWAVHLTTNSALSRAACRDHAYTWVQHGVTAVTAVAVLACMALSLQLVRTTAGASEADGTPAGETMFIGLMGLLVGAVNLALILLEGSYVVFIHPCT